MVGGSDTFNRPAVQATSSSFTNETDADPSPSGEAIKRDEAPNIDPQNSFQRTLSHESEDSTDEINGVSLAPESPMRRSSVGTLDVVNDADNTVMTNTRSPDLISPDVIAEPPASSQEITLPAQEPEGVELSIGGSAHLTQQSMDETNDNRPVPLNPEIVSETNQVLESVQHAMGLADAQNDAAPPQELINDATPEAPTATNESDIAPPLGNNSAPPVIQIASTAAQQDLAPDNHNDDDYDYEDDDDSDDVDNSSLIRLRDLSHFSCDRLSPLTMFGHLGNDDDFLGDINDTEKFYISDHEGKGDTADDDDAPAGNMDVDKTNANDPVAQVQTGNSATAPLPPELPSFPHDGDPDFEDGNNEGTQGQEGPAPIPSDSMDNNFLVPTSPYSPSPFNSQDMHDALKRCYDASRDYTSEMDAPELAARFLNSFSPRLTQRSLHAILGDPTLSQAFLAAAAAHHGVVIQKPIYASRAGHRHPADTNPFHLSHRILLFDLRSNSSVSALGSSPSQVYPFDDYSDAPTSQAVPDGEFQVRNWVSSFYPSRPLLSEDEYEDIHRSSESSMYFIEPSVILETFDAHTASSLLATPLAPSEDDTITNANVVSSPALERNLTFGQFIRQWYVRSNLPDTDLSAEELFVPVAADAAHVEDWYRPPKISRPEGYFKDYDIQGIPWYQKLKVARSDARTLRDQLYRSYHNLKYNPHGYASTLPEEEGYFQSKTMYTRHKAAMEHFQLRNLMSVTASNTLQYACRSKVYSISPFYDERNCIMDLSAADSSSIFLDPVRITTMKSKHGVTVVGGFCGEYALKGEVSDHATVEGYVTRELDGITTHVDVIQPRTCAYPRTAISSNDATVRVLDCETNTLMHVHKFAQPVNCTDTSPDGRLRAIVGDAPDAWIVDAESGKPVQSLIGHRDFGFACAWSPDMLHIATSNQDKTVNIWDARMWRPLQTIDSDVACYRSLRFSPVGGGPRTLLMCEPADRISIVNAQTYQTRQVHDFFGEIGGADFTDDGGRIWVANMDPEFGGFMEYERCQWGQEFGIGHTRRRQLECQGDLYYPDLPNEWVRERDLDDDERCVLGPGERKLRFQRALDSSQSDIHPFFC